MPDVSQSATSVEWGGKLIGQGDWPLGHAEDCRMWTVTQFGPFVYAAKGYKVAVAEGYEKGHVLLEPGAYEFRRLLKVLEQARAYAMRRSA